MDAISEAYKTRREMAGLNAKDMFVASFDWQIMDSGTKRSKKWSRIASQLNRLNENVVSLQSVLKIF